jgi:Putative phage serine protease XkdF
LRISATVVEKREAEHRVFGWAVLSQKRDGSDLIDLQGDHVALPDLEAAVYEAMEAGLNGGEMHQGDAEACIIESFVVTPEKVARLGIPAGVLPSGWWIGQKVSPETFARVQLGDRLWFSIEGVGERERV